VAVRRRLVTFVWTALVLATVFFRAEPASSQPIPPADVPPELRPWIPWVLDEVRDFGCPRVQGQAVCLWPGRLRLDLDAAGGTFVIDVQADRDVAARLPGSADAWPLEVALDGRPVPVLDAGGSPRLRLASGRHRLTGRFAWSRLPESLRVPPEIGLLDLSLDGHSVPRPRREKDGLLWLRGRGEAASEGETLRLQVFRHVADGIPLLVETRVQLEVSGRAREITLKDALLPGTVPIAVGGDLPARIEKGALRVQVRGGRYHVSVTARVEGRPEALVRPKAGAEKGGAPPSWPEREVWVFAANEELRQVELSGPPAIDPSRTELPAEWRSLPAFLVEPGARLAIATVRRGQPEAAPDALQLTRQIWVDPDGGGASVRDSFTGTLHGTTRLDVRPPARLGRVAVDGQDQLVTANPETQAAGVELRRATLRLEADSRLALDGALPAVGWSAGVERLQATLNLPPGWRVLAARGVDDLPGTWTSRWTLLALFFVLLATFAAYRLFGRGAAVLALFTLGLTYGEPGAPLLVWLSLLGAIALRRVAPEGRLGRLGRIWFLASALGLLLLLVPFARDQVRDALYPQVAGGGAYGRGVAERYTTPAESGVAGGVEGGVAGGVLGGRAGGPVRRVPAANLAAAPPSETMTREEPKKLDSIDRLQMQAENEARAKRAALSSPETVTVTADNVALEQDPKAIRQTGPGLPRWSWRRYTLSWTGPVGSDDRMRLFLVSPGLNRLLTVLRLGLVALLGAVVLTGRWPRLPRRRASGATAAALLAALSLAAVAPARAQDETRTPSPAILQELRRRLTRPEPCEPACVTTPSVRLGLAAGRLEVSAEVHAAADGTWPVPGPLATWAPDGLRLDGAPAVAVAQLGDGFLHVRLRPGVHHVEASGPLPPGDSFALQFAEVPRRARASAPEWDVSGLRADGPPDASILFSRRLEARTGQPAAEGRYAPWLEITRTLGFGVTWTVETTVRRVTPLGAPVALRVPLLPGESPTRANLEVEKGAASVSLGGDDEETSWQSTLEMAPTLRLVAPEGQPWSEVWRLQCSALWSCAAKGLPPVHRVSDDVFEPEYRPWPGESLEVALARPAGVEGQTLTLDSVALEATPGTRLERVELTVQARSSREQPLLLHLPEAAAVQQVRLDGDERPLRPEKGELRVTVPTGSHSVAVRWQQARGMGAHYALPGVGLPGAAVNVSQKLTLPPSRWLLLAWGPTWGPAVLFWPYLLFLLAVSYGLGRLPASPLTSTQWVLLGLGLSQIPALGALVVAGFVLALAVRRERPPQGTAAFDLAQLVLGAWALVSLGLVYVAIHRGLLFPPDMQVAGNGSRDTALFWYADRASGTTPRAGVLSLPLWVYRVAMLAWALWLAASLVRGIGWGWRAFGEGGYWRALPWRRRGPTMAEPPKEPPAGEPPVGGD
jgi:hypothetical protein